ncbi:MAG: PAS domain S-box protein [Nitrospirae bacterium]|nr:MAG: PAS domain S-box protein [Nitrospirota bacterium]
MKREEQQDVAQLRSTISALEQLLEVQEQCVVEQSDNVQNLLRDLKERNTEMNRLNGALQGEVAERKRVAEALRSSNDALHAIIQASPLGVLVIDRDGLVKMWNPALERIFGWGEAEVLEGPMPFIPPDKLEESRALRTRVLRNEAFSNVEVVRRKKDGSPVEISLSTAPLHDVNGNISGILGIMADITEHKRAEAALRDSEEQYRALFDSSRDALLLLDHQGFFDCNAAAVQLFGAASKAQLIGVPPWQLSPPTQPDGGESLVGAKDRIAKAYEQGTQFFEWLHRRLDGSLFPADVLLSRYERRGKPVLQAAVRDITERKRDQEQLMEQVRLKAFAAAIAETLAASGSLAGGLQGCTEAMVRYLDGAFARVWMLDPSGTELVMRASAGLYTNLEGAHYRIPVGQFKIGLIAQEQKPHLTNNVIGDPRVPQQDWAKREGMVAFAGYPLLLEGRMLGVMAMFARKPLSENVLQAMHNVAQSVAQFVERKKTEAALAETLAKLQALVRSAPIGINILDAAGHVVLWNPACEALFGWTEQEVLGRPLPTVPESKRDELQSIMDRARQEKFVRILDTKRVTKDGRIVSVELSVSLLRNVSNEVVGYLGMMIDLAERKNLETQMRQFDRLSALTQVLGGIAHQLKNPLFILMGQQRLLEDTAQRYHYDAVMADIHKTQETAKRLAAIVQQFLHLAGPVLPNQGRSSVMAAVKRTLDRLGEELERKHIQVAAAYPQDLPDIEADPALLDDIFLQLMRNAIEAMEKTRGRGTLTVSVQLVTDTGTRGPGDAEIAASPPRRVAASADTGHGDTETRGRGETESAASPRFPVSASAAEGDWIEVRIQDDGPGIPPELRNKLFEPFFTTKPPGEGTGLGLWIVRSNLMMLHGTVQVESEEGQGATFLVRLPVVTEPPLRLDPPPAAGLGTPSSDVG